MGSGINEFEVRTGVAHLCSRNTLVSGLVSRNFSPSPAVLCPVAGVIGKREQLKDFTPQIVIFPISALVAGAPTREMLY